MASYLSPTANNISFVKNILAPLFHVVILDASFHNRIYRTCFFAKSTVDAFEKIDIVSSCAPHTIISDIRIDCNSPSEKVLRSSPASIITIINASDKTHQNAFQ